MNGQKSQKSLQYLNREYRKTIKEMAGIKKIPVFLNKELYRAKKYYWYEDKLIGIIYPVIGISFPCIKGTDFHAIFWDSDKKWYDEPLLFNTPQPIKNIQIYGI